MAGLKNIFRKMLKFGTGVPMFDSEVSKFMKIEMTFLTAKSKTFCNPSRASRPELSPILSSFGRRPSLVTSMEEVPEVRASEVARGRALIANPNYPSKTQLKKIARVLVSAGLGR